MSTIVLAPGAIYADADSLYMAVGHLYGHDESGEQRSTITSSAVGRDLRRDEVHRLGTVPGAREPVRDGEG